jgi:hypothetical protein
MSSPMMVSWRLRLVLTGFAAMLALLASAVTAPPAQAFWIGFGGPCCGWYSPAPYYAYPPPYYYAPPPAYYPPPTAYAAPTAPSAYTPGMPAAGAAATPAISYTSKPAFTNTAGQTCRQYKTTDATNGHPIDVYGTACQQTDGQWRVVN